MQIIRFVSVRFTQYLVKRHDSWQKERRVNGSTGAISADNLLLLRHIDRRWHLNKVKLPDDESCKWMPMNFERYPRLTFLKSLFRIVMEESVRTLILFFTILGTVRVNKYILVIWCQPIRKKQKSSNRTEKFSGR